MVELKMQSAPDVSRRVSRVVSRRMTPPPTRRVIAFDTDLLARAERLAATEIAFIDHPDFRRRNGVATIDALRTESPLSTTRTQVAGPGVAFMPELVGSALLTPTQERYYFLKMNFLRFRAEQLRRKLRPQRPDAVLIEEIESLRDQAEEIRNLIAKSNVRLLVAAAKKLCHSLDQLGDLVSEGLIPLMRAIDLFDVGRGHRFSTYATWAVRNQMIRSLRKQRTLPELAITDEQAGWQHVPDYRSVNTGEIVSPVQRQEAIQRLLSTLSEREQRIVRARFGLDGEPSGQSLAQISAKLGLSKERIRQVVLTALEKLRRCAVETGCVTEEDHLDAP